MLAPMVSTGWLVPAIETLVQLCHSVGKKLHRQDVSIRSEGLHAQASRDMA